jgi:hypothetical protein
MAGITWNGDKWLAKVDAQIVKALKKSADELRDQITKNLSQPRPSGPPGGFPHVGFTSTLRKGIFVGQIEDDGAIKRIKVGAAANIPYAWVQEFGKTIHATKKKALTVPISEAAQKWQATPGNSARTFPIPLEAIPRPGKPTLLVERRDKKGQRNKRSIIHYLLAKSVKVPARPFLRPSVVQKMPRIEQIFREHLE